MLNNPWVHLVMYVASVLLAAGFGGTLAWLRAARKFDYTIRVEKDKRQQIMLTVGTFAASTLGAQVPAAQVKRHVEDVVAQLADLDHPQDEPKTESLHTVSPILDGHHVRPTG